MSPFRRRQERGGRRRDRRRRSPAPTRRGAPARAEGPAAGPRGESARSRRPRRRDVPRGAFREDLFAEACAEVVGIDARLAEIDDVLHGERRAPRFECGAPILRGSHFCPTAGGRSTAGERHGGGRVARASARLRSPRPSERVHGAAPHQRRARSTASSCGLRLPPVYRPGRVAAARLAASRRLVPRATGSGSSLLALVGAGVERGGRDRADLQQAERSPRHNGGRRQARRACRPAARRPRRRSRQPCAHQSRP